MIRIITNSVKTIHRRGWLLFIIPMLILNSAPDVNAQSLLRVKEIRFSGNENISDGTLRGQMNLKSPGFPSFLRKGSEFNARILQLDRASIRKYYESKGYIYAAVSDSFEIIDRKDIIIHVKVNEGKRIKIKEINIRGNDLIADTEILRMFDSKLGEPLNPYLLRKDIAAVRTAYQTRGKPFAQFRNHLTGDDEVTVVIDIKENDTIFLDSVLVSGTQQVKPEIVLRELTFNRDEKYNIEKIRESQKRIFETGLFSNVTIDPVRTDTVNKRLNLIVNVRERKMRQLGGEIGFKQRRIAGSTEPVTDLNVVAEWYNRNLFSTGRLLRFKGNASVGITDISSGQTRFEASYTEPWILGQRAPTTFRTFIERERLIEPEEITLTRFGGDIALFKKYSEEFTARLALGITITRVIGDLSSALSDSLGIREEDNQRSINLLIINDKRRNIFLPTKGSILSLDAKFAGGFLGGDTSDIYRAEVSWSRYQPFFLNKSWTIATRLKGGFISSFGKNTSIPFFDRFFLGGGTSVRGYEELQLQDFTLNPSGAVSRIYKLLSNIELRFPVFWRFGGQLFIDGGNLWDEFSRVSPTKLKYSAGVGFSLLTPMGPVRLDYGYKLGPDEDDTGERSRLHFGLLFAF